MTPCGLGEARLVHVHDRDLRPPARAAAPTADPYGSLARRRTTLPANAIDRPPPRDPAASLAALAAARLGSTLVWAGGHRDAPGPAEGPGRHPQPHRGHPPSVEAGPTTRPSPGCGRPAGTSIGAQFLEGTTAFAVMLRSPAARPGPGRLIVAFGDSIAEAVGAARLGWEEVWRDLPSH